MDRGQEDRRHRDPPQPRGLNPPFFPWSDTAGRGLRWLLQDLARLAYADPPYLGMCSYYGHEHGDGGCWDQLETHADLIRRLDRDFDGWALSMGSTNLRDLLPLTPTGTRVCPWVKPFCSWKPGQRIVWAWEPVLVREPPGRESDGTNSVRDWLAASMAMRGGFVGQKPPEFSRWVFDLLGAKPTDDFSDLFVGSGAVSAEWRKFAAQRRLELA